MYLCGCDSWRMGSTRLIVWRKPCALPLSAWTKPFSFNSLLKSSTVTFSSSRKETTRFAACSCHSTSGATILVFYWTIDFFGFLLKNWQFDSIFGQTFKGEYNYQRPALMRRPVMQSGVLEFASLNCCSMNACTVSLVFLTTVGRCFIFNTWFVQGNHRQNLISV